VEITFNPVGLAQGTLEEAIAGEADRFLKGPFPRLKPNSVSAKIFPNGDGDDRVRRAGGETHNIVIVGELDLDAFELADLQRNTARNKEKWRTAVAQAITAAASTLQNENIVDSYVAPEVNQIWVEFGQSGGRVLSTTVPPPTTVEPTTITTTTLMLSSTDARAEKQLIIMVPVLCAVALIAAILLSIGCRGDEKSSSIGDYQTDEGNGGYNGNGHYQDQSGGDMFDASFEASFDDWGGVGLPRAQAGGTAAEYGGADTSYLSAKGAKSVYLGDDMNEQTSWV
jgi:hypothetical protein